MMRMAAMARGWRMLVLAWAMALAACGGGDVAEDVAAKADVSTFKANGIWWNPSESGSGFFFEAQGATGVVTFYSYETNGRPVWYLASGPFAGIADDKFQFSGTLLRYSGGQAANSTVAKTPTSAPVGTVTITFSGETAQVQVPGRSYSAEKFNKAGQFTPATNIQPETGAFWNPGQGGRGYVMEVANGIISVAVFHYADDGQPTWNLVAAPVPMAGQTAKGPFVAYSGGQTLAGAYKAPTSSSQGTFAVLFGEPCNGKLAFPDMSPVAVKRFAFGSLAAGAECRTVKGSPPRVGYLPELKIALTGAGEIFRDFTKGSMLRSNYSFTLAGDVSSLQYRTLYLVVEDPEGFYGPKANVYLGSSGLSVNLVPVPLQRAGLYDGELRFYACLNDTCSVQLTGSPIIVPYYFRVKS